MSFLRPIKFSTGHELVDNKFGDLGLVCPEHGYVGFMHLGQVAQILNREVACPSCGNLIRASQQHTEG